MKSKYYNKFNCSELCIWYDVRKSHNTISYVSIIGNLIYTLWQRKKLNDDRFQMKFLIYIDTQLGCKQVGYSNNVGRFRAKEFLEINYYHSKLQYTGCVNFLLVFNKKIELVIKWFCIHTDSASYAILEGLPQIIYIYLIPTYHMSI